MNKQQNKVLYYNLDILLDIIQSKDSTNKVLPKYRTDLSEILLKIMHDTVIKSPHCLEAAQMRDVITKYTLFQETHYPDVKPFDIGDLGIIYSSDSHYSFKFHDEDIAVNSKNVREYLKSLGFYFVKVNKTWRVKRMISISTDNFDLEMFKTVILERYDMDKKARVS